MTTQMTTQDDAQQAKPNYGTLERDEESGLPYIVCATTSRRLFYYPQCDICGMIPRWYSNQIRPVDQACGFHRADRRERNDNDE